MEKNTFKSGCHPCTVDPSKHLTHLVPIIIDGKPHPTISFDLLSNHLINQSDVIVSHDYPNLVGADYSLRYDHGLVTLPGEVEAFRLQGDIPMASKWEPHYAHPVLKGDFDLGLDLASGVMEQFGVALKGSTFHKTQMDSAPYLFASTAMPSGLIKYENLKNYILWSVLIFNVDDIMDNRTDLKTTELSAMETVRCLDLLCDALEGKPLDEEKMQAAGNFPKHRALWNFCSDFRNRLIAQSRCEEEWKLCVESLIEWLEGVAWEHGGWSCPDVREWDLETYWGVRELTLGFTPSLEIVCLSAHIRIAPEMRRDPLMRNLFKMWKRLMGFANDIMSLPKELANGEINNYFVIAARTNQYKSGVDLLNNLQNTVFPRLIREIRFMESQLLLKFNNDPSLKKFMHCGRRVPEGLAMWSFIANRYDVPGKKLQVVFFTKDK